MYNFNDVGNKRVNLDVCILIEMSNKTSNSGSSVRILGLFIRWERCCLLEAVKYLKGFATRMCVNKIPVFSGYF
mgnify:CR=1 FL=1